MGFSHCLGILGDGKEGFLDINGPSKHVDKKGGLSGVHLEPLCFSQSVKSSERINTGISKGGTHSVNNLLHVVLDLTHKLKVRCEFNVLDTDICVHTNGGWTFLIGILKLKVFNSLEDFAHESHDLDWV